MSVAGTLSLWIAWDGSTYEDVSADLMMTHGLTAAMGRDDVSSPVARAVAGELTATLRNDDGDYSPFNTASPLYPNTLPRRPAQLRVTYDGDEYVLWTGYLQELRPSAEQFFPRVHLTAWGPLSLLTKDRNRAAPMSGVDTGAAFTAVLDAAGVAVDHDAETGQTTIGVAIWGDEVPTLDRIHRIEEAEQGLIHEHGDGELHFHDRHYRYRESRSRAVQFTVADDGSGLDYTGFEYESPLRFIFNEATAVVTPFTALDLAVLWDYEPETPLDLHAGSTLALVAEYAPASGATAYVSGWETPTIGLPGSGADVIVTPGAGGGTTADLAIGATVTGATTLRISIQNTSGQHWYLVGAQARGTAATTGASVTVEATDAASIADFGERPFPYPSTLLSDLGEAQGLVNEIVRRWKGPQPFVRLDFIANLSHDHMQAALTAQINDRVHLTATGSKTRGGIDRDSFIERIEHSFEGTIHRVRWLLSPTDDADHYYWTFPHATFGVTSGPTTIRLAAW